MLAVASKPLAEKPLPPLQNGDHLAADEFLRRYEAMPEDVKAELIDGIVYMASPVILLHARLDNLLQTWLGTYVVHTPGIECAANATLILDGETTVQPDAMLYIAKRSRTTATKDNYLSGAPELVAEIATSSAALDLSGKLPAYQRHGVGEYLVWSTYDAEFYWFVLEDGRFEPHPPGPDGIIRSRQFPGLHLAVHELLEMNGAAVLAAVQRGLQLPEHAAFVAELAAR